MGKKVNLKWQQETLRAKAGLSSRMAVPKKKISYTRKRKRIAGLQAITGSKLQTHLYMCPVCERMRAPHRVCGREDCSTYATRRSRTFATPPFNPCADVLW